MKLTPSFAGLCLIFLSLLLAAVALALGLRGLLLWPAVVTILLYLVAVYHFLFEGRKRYGKWQK